MPSSTALRKCPDLVFVPPRFEVYRAVSHQIRAIFADYTALIEPLSLDEAYLDVTENLRGTSTASATAAEIRARIFDETGLTASAGISYNKFLAKLASDHCKPNGQFVVTPAMAAAFVETLPIGKFHGVGPVTADKMKRLGIFTGADLKRQSLEFLQQHFGKSGIWCHRQWRGQSSGRAGPPTQIRGIGKDLCRRPDRSGRHRGRRAGDGGRGLGLVRKDAGLRPHSDRKDQVCRLPAGDAQPNPACDDYVSGNLPQREHRPRAHGVSASQRHPAARRDVVGF